MPRLYSIPFLYLLCSLFLIIAQPAAAHNRLNVVVSIRPLFSLVAAVMHGVGKPVLLLNTTQSPHHINLRPSDYRKLAHADIVFWAGPAMETFMPALIKKDSPQTAFYALMQAPGIERLSIRPIHTSAPKKVNAQTDTTAIDPHFWLSTNNAMQMVKAITHTLIHMDRPHAAIYVKNRQQTLLRIKQLHAQLKTKLYAMRTPFISYHDAYQYFEKDYHLNRLASVNLNETASPGIKQIRYIKQLIKKRHITCVFYEAPVKPPLIHTLIANTSAKAVELDILGLFHPVDRFLWFDVLKQTADRMAACLRK